MEISHGLNDLRKKERSIFIIATNYANRIDPAIKRRGRIDQHYLLMLPDAQKRLAIIKSLRNGKAVTESLAQQVCKSTLFFGYSDLSGVVKEARARGGTDEALVAALQSGEYRPSTSIETYIARWSDEQFPFDELLALADLNEEIEHNFDVRRSKLPLEPPELKEKLEKFASTWRRRCGNTGRWRETTTTRLLSRAVRTGQIGTRAERRAAKMKGLSAKTMPDPSTQPLAAIRQVWRSAFGSRRVAYLSGPITTGQRFLAWWEKSGHKLDPLLAEYRDALRTHVIGPNEEALRVAAELLRASCVEPVIEPASLFVAG